MNIYFWVAVFMRIMLCSNEKSEQEMYVREKIFLIAALEGINIFTMLDEVYFYQQN